MPRRKGAYAPLAALYYIDDAIIEAGPAAELMWVRVLSFLASVASDGFITERQLRHVGINLRDWRSRVDALQLVGLLIPVDDGYEARNWKKWNRTAEMVNRELAKDRERKASKSKAEAGISVRNGEAFRTDSSPKSSTEQNRTEQNKDFSSEVATATTRPDIERLLDILDEEIVRNGSKAPARTKKNLDAMRLLLDHDGHPVEHIERAIHWSQSDPFWRSNILSAFKLRQKYDQMRLDAQRRDKTMPASTSEHGRSVHDELLARRAATGMEIGA